MSKSDTRKRANYEHFGSFTHGAFSSSFFFTQGLIVTLVRSLTCTGLTLYHYHTLGAWEKHVFAVDMYFHTLLNYLNFISLALLGFLLLRSIIRLLLLSHRSPLLFFGLPFLVASLLGRGN